MYLFGGLGKNPHYRFSAQCPYCGAPLVLRSNNSDLSRKFFGCSTYPACRFTEPYDTTIDQLGTVLRELEHHKATDRAFLRQELLTAIEKCHPNLHPQAPALALEIRLVLIGLREKVSI